MGAAVRRTRDPENEEKMKMRATAWVLAAALAFTSGHAQAASAADPVVVNVDNFNRAQTDFEFDGIIKLAGGINTLHHNRTPTPIDKQNVIRMNRDTLYSLGVVDISKGATVTLPESGKRYMSLMVINNGAARPPLLGMTLAVAIAEVELDRQTRPVVLIAAGCRSMPATPGVRTVGSGGEQSTMLRPPAMSWAEAGATNHEKEIFSCARSVGSLLLS